MQYDQTQLEAIEQTGKMIGGVMMELDDETGVGGVKCDLLNQIYLRLADLQRLCYQTIEEIKK